MGYNINRYWVNKEKRATIAKEHTQEMEYYYGEEIKDCIKESKIYNDSFKLNHLAYTKGKMNIVIKDMDSVSAVFEYSNQNDITTVLNFASYKNPGGMFINGSKAQEECLCHESYLYNVLKEFDNYYDWNNKHKNKALYLNRAIYSPNVRFERDEDVAFCDVITCASPNKTASQKYCYVSDEENSKVLRDRIEFILKIAQDNLVETLILGAFGCGVFGQSPIEVATIFKELLTTKYQCFNKVIFAIPDKKGENYIAFKEVLKDVI